MVARAERQPLNCVRPRLAFPGFSDYVLAATFTGHLGVTTGTANVYPKTIAKLWELCLKAKKEPSPENVAAAEEVQFMVIESDA